MSKDVVNEIEKVIFNKDYVCIYEIIPEEDRIVVIPN